MGLEMHKVVICKHNKAAVGWLDPDEVPDPTKIVCIHPLNWMWYALCMFYIFKTVSCHYLIMVCINIPAFKHKMKS